MDQHYNPTVYKRLQQLFAAAEWDALIGYLNGLSNAHFRTAGYLIGERMLTTVDPDTFWAVASRLILWQPKAFVVTMAKAATPRLSAGTLSLDDDGFLRLADSLKADDHLIDRQKLLFQWMPAAKNPQTMATLFDRLHIQEPRRRVEFLLRTEGLTAAFVLLRTLRFEEHDSEYLTTVCRHLIRRADNLSYNLASLLRTYFDLPDIRGTFSLSLEPYELSRLDTDFEVFRRIVTKV